MRRVPHHWCFGSWVNGIDDDGKNFQSAPPASGASTSMYEDFLAILILLPDSRTGEGNSRAIREANAPTVAMKVQGDI